MRSNIRTRFLAFAFLLRTGRGYLRNALANVIKRALGREPYLDKAELVFRALARYRLGLAPKPCLTSRSLPGEGIGSQIRLTMSAINLSHALGLSYVHTPFEDVGRADRPMESWATAWEDEFNLGAGEQVYGGKGEVIDLARSFNAVAKAFGRTETFRLIDGRREEFRARYYRNKTRRRNAVLTVAVHVRRDDVAHPGNRGRWAEWHDVFATVRQLKALLDARGIPYRIELFSDGDSGEFRELEAAGAQLFVNRDALWTMRQMIEADFFVMGRGYFSYVAAIISDGIKLWDQWGDTPPLEGWIVRDAQGRFDEIEFGAALETCLAELQPTVA